MTEQLAPIEPTNARERELRDRAVRDYAALQAAQLETGRTFFPPGTEADIARVTGRIAQKRNAHEELPFAKAGLEALTQRVLDEDRQDTLTTIGKLLTSGRGWLVGNESLAPTERACQQILAHRPADHPAPPLDIVAWIGDVSQDKELVLRNRKLPEWRKRAYFDYTRECYAAVSPSYQPYDLDAAANDLSEVAPADARCRIRYDGQRATADVILANPHYLDGGDAAGVGEAHRVVLRMRTADDGSGGYHVSLLAERVRCINLTLLHAKRSLFHGTHRQDNLRELAQDALGQVEPLMEAFAAQWREGWQQYYVDKYTKGSLSGEEAIRRIVGSGRYKVPGLGTEGTLDAALAALAEEPGDSKVHVHNALTAAAHKAPVTWATRWSDDAAEEQASALLYQKVLWLPEVDNAAN